MNEMRTLHISWQMHATAMSSNLRKLFSEHIFTDVSIACEGKLYPAHKFVLSTYSEYFEEIFSNTQGSSMVVVLKDVPKKDLECVLEYMYLGEVDVSQEDFVNFLKTSEFLKMKSLPMLHEEGREASVFNDSEGREASVFNDSEGREASVFNDSEGREASLAQKKRKLYKENRSSIKVINVYSSRSNNSTHDSPTPGSSMQSEATSCHPALPLQQSIQTNRAHRVLPPEVRLFPGNVTTTMISENAQPEVFPDTPSPATKRHPLVTIPTTPTFMCFSSPSESPTYIKEEVDPHCFLEVCTEDMDQVDFGTENERPDLCLPSQNMLERDQFIYRKLIDRNQEDFTTRPSKTLEETTGIGISQERGIVVSRSSTRISEEGKINRDSEEATESKASKKARKDRTTKHGSKKKPSKRILDDTTKNLIRPCHVLLEQLAVVEENGVLRWRNPSHNSFKRSSRSTQSRPQRGKENSAQERSGAPLSKRTLAPSAHFTKFRKEIENCNADMAVEEIGVANIVTEPNEEVEVINAEAGDARFQQELISQVTDPLGAGTSDVLYGIGDNFNTACMDTTSPALQVLPCRSCNLTFLEKNTRDMHEHLHQGNHICLYCNQTFTASSMQRTHMLLHDSHVAPLHAHLKKTSKRKKWYFVFLHLGHPCVQLEPDSRPVVIRTRLELEKLMSLIKHAKSTES